MTYHLNYDFVWRHFSRLSWGLVLSLELAFVSILIGIAIGLSLALAYTGGGRFIRSAVAGYVEFIRNVPLLLLVYLIFYGVPSMGGFAYGATESFIITLVGVRRGDHGRGVPRRSGGRAPGADRRGQGHRPNAGGSA